MGLFSGLASIASDMVLEPFGKILNDITGVSASARQQYKYNSALQNDAQGYNAEEAEKTRVFNAKQAQLERDWQTEMSNTARQRAVSDLKSAGINPILAAGAGADAGAGATASGGQATSPGGSTSAGVAGGNPITMITDLINASNNTARTEVENEQTKVATGLAPKLAMAEIALKGAQAGNQKAKEAYTTIMTNVDKELKNADKNLKNKQANKTDKETPYGGKTMGTVSKGANTARDVLKLLPGGKWLF